MFDSYIFRRINPLVAANQMAWEHTRQAYSGGKEYIAKALVRHQSETEASFAERLKLAHYDNYPKTIARRISQFLYSGEPQRDGADQDIIDDWSRSGMSANEVMTQLSTMLNLYGIAWLKVDIPAVSGKVDMETKIKQRIRPYVQAMSPFAVPDWSFGQDGRLEWAITEEFSQDRTDPYKEPVNIHRRRLWTRNEWHLFERRSDFGSDLREVASGTHNLGIVPLIMVEESDGFGIGAAHWFGDIVSISDAILNEESESQMNIRKQMFGQLIISADFARSLKSEIPEDKPSMILGRSCAIWETPEEKGTSRYISPTGAETAAIRSEINELKKTMYETVGLALQNSSKEAQTAESKAWDSHNIQQFLSARATMLEQKEIEAWKIINMWDPSISIPDVSYNHEFNVIDLQSSVSSLMDVSTFADASETFRKQTAIGALDLLNRIRRIPPSEYQKAVTEIMASEKELPELPKQKNPVDASDESNKEDIVDEN